MSACVFTDFWQVNSAVRFGAVLFKDNGVPQRESQGHLTVCLELLNHHCNWLPKLANHMSVWQLSLNTRLGSQCNFQQIQSVYSFWRSEGFRQGRETFSFATLCEIWIRLNFYFLNLIYSHTLQTYWAFRLFSLMQFSWWQNQRHGCKYKWSCWRSHFVVKADVAMLLLVCYYFAYISDSREKPTDTTVPICKCCFNPCGPRELNARHADCSRNSKSDRLANMTWHNIITCHQSVI